MLMMCKQSGTSHVSGSPTIRAPNRHPISRRFRLTDNSRRFFNQRGTKCNVDCVQMVGHLLRPLASTIRAPNRYPIGSRFGFIDDSCRFLARGAPNVMLTVYKPWKAFCVLWFRRFEHRFGVRYFDRSFMTTKFYVICFFLKKDGNYREKCPKAIKKANMF